MSMKCPEITTNPEVLGGTPVFKGTRVPIQSLFQHLEAGDSLTDFLAGFPSVSKTQAITVLEHAEKSVISVA
jgi:uncharacterized protein (DUF433 family)